MVKRKNTEINLDRTATSIKRFGATVLGTMDCSVKCATESHAAALATRSCSKKNATESQKMRMKFTVGYWNARSLRQVGKYEILKHEASSVKNDIILVAQNAHLTKTHSV